MAAEAAASIDWSPELLGALLDELHVDDTFHELIGDVANLSTCQYPQAVAVALMLRHSWRADDFASTLERLGLIDSRAGRTRRARNP